VRLLTPADPAIKVPHMGWNDVAVVPHARFHPVIEPGEAYYLHSYHLVAQDPADVAALTDHGEGIVSAVARGNILGVQFHPEKSQAHGIALLERFLEWAP
jgi:glutamine amidotransferase